MKYLIYLTFLCLYFSCSTNVSYISIGKEYPAKADSAFIRVYMTKIPTPDSYEEIGIVVVSGGNLETRIKSARVQARQVGGNGLLLLEEKLREKWQNNTKTIEESRKDEEGNETKITKTKIVPEKKSWTEQRFLVIKTHE